MPDKKLTDNEIIKALNKCLYGYKSCDECPLCNDPCEIDHGGVPTFITDLINRQKARIDLLEKDNKYLAMRLKNAETNAFVEFSDRLKLAFFEDYEIKNSTWLKAAEHIDNLVKEMVGE